MSRPYAAETSPSAAKARTVRIAPSASSATAVESASAFW